MPLEHRKVSVDVVVDVVVVWCSIVIFLFDFYILSKDGSLRYLLLVLIMIINVACGAVSSNESCRQKFDDIQSV